MHLAQATLIFPKCIPVLLLILLILVSVSLGPRPGSFCRRVCRGITSRRLALYVTRVGYHSKGRRTSRRWPAPAVMQVLVMNEKHSFTGRQVDTLKSTCGSEEASGSSRGNEVAGDGMHLSDRVLHRRGGDFAPRRAGETRMDHTGTWRVHARQVGLRGGSFVRATIGQF